MFIGMNYEWPIIAHKFIKKMLGVGRSLIDKKPLKLEKLTLLIKEMREKL
jgi:hypothetical protein